MTGSPGSPVGAATRPPGRRRPLLAACLAAAAGLAGVAVPAGPVSLAGQSRQDREVVDLDFVGNETFSDEELRRVIETRATTCKSVLLEIFPICGLTDWGFAHNRAYLDEDDVPVDLLRLRVFYIQRGYREATVDSLVDRRDGEAALTFLIEEGEPTRIESFSIDGVEGILDTMRVRRAIGLAPGDPFDRVAVIEGKEIIASRLRNLGYMDAVVLEDAFLPPEGGARITLRAQPGIRYRVGEITMEGAEAIGEDVVRQFMTLQSGRYVGQEKILESQRALFGLDAVRFASITQERTGGVGDTLLDIRVRITPAPTRVARAGGGWSTDRCLQAEARLTHRNFFGGARRLELTGRLNNMFASIFEGSFPCPDVGRDPAFHQLNYLLQLEFQQPYFFSARNAFRARLFGQRESVPDVFVRTTIGAETAVTRELRSRMTATLAYRPEFGGFDENSADIFFCVNFGICTRDDIELVSEPAWLSPAVLSWLYNRTNAPFAPTSGYYLAADAEVAGEYTGSQWRYVRLAIQAADFETLEPGLVFGARLRTGVVEPTGGFTEAEVDGGGNDLVHPAKRFFAGGAQSVRGFGQNLLGPTVLVMDAVEDCGEGQELPDCADELARTDPGQFIERPIGGNAFAELSLELRQDLGESWRVVGFLDLGQVWESLSEIEAPILTPGIGIRYRTPVGPFRLDVGYNPSSPVLLPVVATFPDGDIVELENPVLFDPFTYDDPSLLKQVWRRLRLHFSIGEAF